MVSNKCDARGKNLFNWAGLFESQLTLTPRIKS